jgi:hypothetical protein
VDEHKGYSRFDAVFMPISVPQFASLTEVDFVGIDRSGGSVHAIWSISSSFAPHLATFLPFHVRAAHHIGLCGRRAMVDDVMGSGRAHRELRGAFLSCHVEFSCLFCSGTRFIDERALPWGVANTSRTSRTGPLDAKILRNLSYETGKTPYRLRFLF